MSCPDRRYSCTHKSGKTPCPLPVYDHDDLNRCFPALLRILRNDLASMIEKRVISINLVKNNSGFISGNWAIRHYLRMPPVFLPFVLLCLKKTYGAVYHRRSRSARSKRLSNW
ncbi:type VI secretion system baseplate subunit TssK [Ochrobactrum oryzae]|nr:type VI secretion system baseplate subunit TssK [Brucella oryzae]